MESFEENRAQDISQAKVLNSLSIFFHDIREADVKFLYHGSYNVFEVKDRYIFRFPDKHIGNTLGIELILNEIKMLKFLQNHISISIPDPLFISIEKDNPFVGSEKIEGISLSKCFDKVPQNKKMTIANQIGEFLSQLHSIELYENIMRERILGDPFSLIIYRKNWQKYFENLRVLTFPILSEKQQRWINKLFIDFLNNQENFNFQPSVVHGDFDTSNILINPQTFELTGIIDFEDSKIYDPAVDFIFYEEGESFHNQILSCFRNIKRSNLNERIKFLYGRSCLPYIEFGLKHNLDEMIGFGIRKLNKIMAKFETLS
jgi:aminoglycoside 2''-phosphotransferase